MWAHLVDRDRFLSPDTVSMKPQDRADFSCIYELTVHSQKPSSLSAKFHVHFHFNLPYLPFHLHDCGFSPMRCVLIKATFFSHIVNCHTFQPRIQLKAHSQEALKSFLSRIF